MTREDKELLLKDICARLPYEIKVKFYDHWVDEYEIIPLTAKLLSDTVYIGDIKPYLFPLSSMTDEQKKTLKVLCDWNDEEADAQSILVLYQKHFVMKSDVIDWLHKNHFDYRGLIEKGLAIDATDKNIY